GIADRAGPGELGIARRVEQAPVGSDATFIGLPGLIESFDDVVVDAVGVGAGDEVTDHLRLLDAAGIGALVVVTGARPTELRNHDALARKREAQVFILVDRVVYGLARGFAVPVGQDMNGDEVHRCGESCGLRYLLLVLLALVRREPFRVRNPSIP